MYSNSEIKREFAIEVYKLKNLINNGFLNKLVHQKLLDINNGEFSSFYTNKTTIDIAENSVFNAELKIIRKVDFLKKNTFHSLHFEMCLIPIVGSLNIVEFSIDDSAKIYKKALIDNSKGLFFFGKTSNSLKVPHIVPNDEICIVVICTHLQDHDEIYLTYNEESLNLEEVVSTNISESRIEFWLDFFPQIKKELNRDLIDKIKSQAKNPKLIEFLKEL